MYSRKAWDGPVDPYISVSFVPQKSVRRRANETLSPSIAPTSSSSASVTSITESVASTSSPTSTATSTTESSSTPENDSLTVSVVIFEWKDEALVGVADPDSPLQRVYICDGTSVRQKLCTAEQLGQYILAPDWNATAHNPLMTVAVRLSHAEPVKYPVSHTGYYCVFTDEYTALEYEGEVEFRNAYGQLEASQIPKLPFYGALTVVYGVLAVFWGFLYFQNRHDILAVQNYITAVVVFLIFEQFATWGFYEYSNTHGSNAFAKILTFIVAILNAARNSFSFFLLLIVCMGYGVVKQTLGKTMWYVRVLTGCHFLFSVVYVIASLQITPDNAGPIVLFIVLPLAATLTAFYVWTLNSLGYTRKDLLERRQTVKAAMYAKLWYCILGSILVIFGFFFLNSFTFAGRRNANFVPDHWKGRWFILDGWLNLVYLFDLSFIAYLWRPTANNRRFAMSDELAQDDDGFEIESFAGSEDEEALRSPHPASAALSPMPPTPMDEHPKARRSLQGETIFAVGEDADKWSDASDRESAERRRG